MNKFFVRRPVRKALLFNCIAVALFLIVSCSNTGNKVGQQYTVAAILDFTGHYGDYGIEARRGMELALKEVDNIKVVFLDSEARSDIALSHLGKIDDNIPVVVSFTSWVSNTIAPVAAERGLLQIIIASAAFKHDKLKSSVRFTVDVNAEAEFLLGYLQRYDSIGIMYIDNEYGTGWKNSLVGKLGAKIVSVEGYNNATKDFTPQLRNMKSANPEAIVLISFGEAAEIIRQSMAMGITAQFIGTRPILTKDLLKEPLAEGLIFSYPDLDETHPFYNKFRKEYGVNSTAFGAEGYDVIITLAQALNEKGDNPDGIHAWYKNRSHKGALGEIKFDEHGLAYYDFTLKQIQKGEVVSYTP